MGGGRERASSNFNQDKCPAIAGMEKTILLLSLSLSFFVSIKVWKVRENEEKWRH
jgi:hypothetical protein